MPRLDDPKEFKIVKEVYFGEHELSEDAERVQKRNKKQSNQAR